MPSVHKGCPRNCVILQAEYHEAVLEYFASGASPSSGKPARQSYWPTRAQAKTKEKQQAWSWASSTRSKEATRAESSPCTVRKLSVSKSNENRSSKLKNQKVGKNTIWTTFRIDAITFLKKHDTKDKIRILRSRYTFSKNSSKHISVSLLQSATYYHEW